MGKRAAWEARVGDSPSLTPTPHLPPGTVVVLDLDEFEEVTRERGYDEYRPNEVTGLLSALVEGFARKWQAVIVYGLDWERGTEEALIEVPYVEASEVSGDLVEIAREVGATGVSVTIVAVTGHVAPWIRGDRSAYTATPTRRTALKILERLKARGGGVVYVDGRIVYTLAR
ncbi:hypothetical protein [Stetteria hydrogenophila]